MFRLSRNEWRDRQQCYCHFYIEKAEKYLYYRTGDFMRHINMTRLVIISGVFVSGLVSAGGGHGGGGHFGGGHGGGHFGGWHGGGHFGGWHGGAHFGYDLGLGFYGWPYYPYPYYPPIVPVPSTPPVYTQQDMPSTPQAPPPQNSYWYYCRNPDGYYPYIRECPGGWETVSPQPPGR